ncbi:hypothetical protein JAAARDRAFT_404850 [Jaapia argillacea MUCL 33604]|uniref:EXPERA domain-containing protein n=1 Tax=Jaapia argillacea MUCL 33604 TaxID=933084 RepID=A0A067PHC3_9AGAM|nr:hypothetical protein JAAARDRAFT_404850 [Jaapia argillacea MUCL 33604]
MSEFWWFFAGLGLGLILSFLVSSASENSVFHEKLPSHLIFLQWTLKGWMVRTGYQVYYSTSTFLISPTFLRPLPTYLEALFDPVHLAALNVLLDLPPILFPVVVVNLMLLCEVISRFLLALSSPSRHPLNNHNQPPDGQLVVTDAGGLGSSATPLPGFN